MALTHIPNGNISFGVRNGVEPGTWHSASFHAMLLEGEDRAAIDVRAKSGTAKFTRMQLEQIAADLLQLAAQMPEQEPVRALADGSEAKTTAAATTPADAAEACIQGLLDELALYVDEGGLPKHLPMPVNTEGQGPLGFNEDGSPETPARIACWCGDAECMWALALTQAYELGSMARNPDDLCRHCGATNGVCPVAMASTINDPRSS